MNYNPNNEYVRVMCRLEHLVHGQEISVEPLKSAYRTAQMFGTIRLTCTNKEGVRVTVAIQGALRCLDGFGNEKTLVVSCDEEGFIFKLPKLRIIENLKKNGYSKEDIERIMSKDV